MCSLYSSIVDAREWVKRSSGCGAESFCESKEGEYSHLARALAMNDREEGMKKLSDSLRELADRVDNAEQKAGDNQKVHQIMSKIAVTRALSSGKHLLPRRRKAAR